jgi:hypothetical protein
MAKAKFKNVAEFRGEHDKNVTVPNKIRAALVSLAKEGPEAGEYEREFIQRAGVSQTDFCMFRDKFEAFIVNVGSERSPKRVWFATEKAAKAARGV